jgi:hypothetical protein
MTSSKLQGEFLSAERFERAGQAVLFWIGFTQANETSRSAFRLVNNSDFGMISEKDRITCSARKGDDYQ